MQQNPVFPLHMILKNISPTQLIPTRKPLRNFSCCLIAARSQTAEYSHIIKTEIERSKRK